MEATKIFSHDFFLLCLSQFAFSSIFHMFLPTLPIYLSKGGSNDTEVGILIGVLNISSLILRPFVGKGLLKTPERTFMLAGTFLYVLCSLAYLVMPPFWPLLALRVFQGVGHAFFYTASFTLIASLTPETQRGQGLSYFALSMNMAAALGPVFGMFLVNAFGFSFLFAVGAALSFCSLILTARLGRRETTPLGSETHRNGAFFNSRAVPPSMMAFFTLLLIGGIGAFFPVYAIRQGMENPGIFFLTFSVMLILGRSFGGKMVDRYRRETVILPCLVTQVVSMVILAFSKTTPLFIAVAVIWGAGHAFLFPTIMASVLDRAGSSRGPAMGTFTALTDLGGGLGPVIMGFILYHTNYTIMFLCLALSALINFIYFCFFVRRGEGRSE